VDAGEDAIDVARDLLGAMERKQGTAEPRNADGGVEAIDHPQHYNAGKFEVIDVIEDWQLGFHEGNVVKYVGRAKHKGRELEDLKKARWYLDRRIEQLEDE
jgi:hypothetical protein